jgi:hypothetical protein
MHLIVSALVEVSGSGVVIHVVIHAIVSEVCGSSLVDMSVLANTENSIDVLLRDGVLWELEAQFVVA